MNLGSMVRECEIRTGFNDSEFQARWRIFLNDSLRDYARRYPWPGLEKELTTTLRASERFLVLPHIVDQVVSILNVTDRSPIIRKGEWHREAPSVYANLTQGRPLEYDLAGIQAVQANPTGFIWFNSSNASDVDTVFVTGFAAASGSSTPTFDLIQQTVSTQADGTTPVTLSTQLTEVISISKVTSTNGDFFFHDAGNSDSYVSFIPASEQEARYRRLQFLFVPSADKSLRIKYRLRLPTLVDDTQAPHPSVKADYLIEKAIALFQRYQTQYSKSQFHDAEAEATVAEEANREENFGESFSQIIPECPPGTCDDPDTIGSGNW